MDLTQILQKVNLLCQIVTQAVILRKWEEKEKKIISIAVEAVLQAPKAQSQKNLITKAKKAQIKIKTCLVTNNLEVLFKNNQLHQALKTVHQSIKAVKAVQTAKYLRKSIKFHFKHQVPISQNFRKLDLRLWEAFHLELPKTHF